jgi:hypothetical protein
MTSTYCCEQQPYLKHYLTGRTSIWLGTRRVQILPGSCRPCGVLAAALKIAIERWTLQVEYMRAYRTENLPRWDLAAVVVAIIAVPLAMSPAASSFIRDIFFVLLRTMWPSSAQCERLGWDDTKEGVLHRRRSPKENCQHVGA